MPVVFDSSLGQLYHGDCSEVLKELPSESVDAMVTDPPAAVAFMGSKWDSFSSFQAFQDFLTGVFTEAYRVLKPGAHALVWSLPRTSHHTAMALERAGFETRDAINNVKDRSAEVESFLRSLTPEQVELLVRAGPTDGVFLHCFGSGFPKSLNVGKAIDKLKGVERRVVGVKPGHEEFAGRKTRGHITAFREGALEGFDRPWMHDEAAQERYHQQTAPGTPEAEKWEGFGTALKPAIEIWWLVRKPLREKSIAEQVLATGTGAINIDGCRVGYVSEEDQASAFPGGATTSRKVTGGGLGCGMKPHERDTFEATRSTGRWPSNLTLQHSPACKIVGTKTVKGDPRGECEGERPGGFFSPGSEAGSGEPNARVYGDQEVPVYECAPGCPVPVVDEQSGDTTSGAMKREVAAYGGESVTPFLRGRSGPSNQHGGSGGASRFFNTFESETPVYECAPGCPVKALDEQSGELQSGSGTIKRASSKGYQANTMHTESRPADSPQIFYGDAGGASRFFNAFEPDPNAPPFFYTGKATTKERNEGLEGFEPQAIHSIEDQSISTQSNRRCKLCGEVKFGQPHCECEEPEWEETAGSKVKNFHPTLKPQKLMRHLVRLVTPPEGVVLDPFAGSGSTLVAALAEGMHFIGIEREDSYVAIAKARVEKVVTKEEEDREYREFISDFMPT